MWKVDGLSLFLLYSPPVAGPFSMNQIQPSTLEMLPFPCFRFRLTVVVFQFQWKCQVSLFPSHPKSPPSSHHE